MSKLLKVTVLLAFGVGLFGVCRYSAAQETQSAGAYQTPNLGRAVPGPNSLLNLMRRHPAQVAAPAGDISSSVAHQPSVLYYFVSVDYPGAALSVVFDFNDYTEVGAFNYSPDTMGSNDSGFIFKNGRFSTVNYPGAVATDITAINASGEIVGYYTDSSNTAHAFQDVGGTFTNIDYPSFGNGTAFDLNDAGDIVGFYGDASGNVHGFLLSGGVYSSFDYPGATTTEAAGINNLGEVVGAWIDSSNKNHGFTLIGGVFNSLDYPTSTSTTAVGVNDSGEVGGLYEDASKVFHGFVYANGFFGNIDVPGGTGTEVARIKNNGRLLGAFFDQLGETHGFSAVR
jgi:probable HAF family extracellular repeat protein